MRQVVGFGWLAIAAVAALLVVPAVAGAQSGTATCTDVLAPGTYQRVVIPADAVCFSTGPVTIRSGLFIGSGATFVLGSEEAPGDNGTIDINVLNNRNWIDVTFNEPLASDGARINPRSITDLNPEFTLGGNGIGTLVLDSSKAPVLLTVDDGVVTSVIRSAAKLGVSEIAVQRRDPYMP